jgi:TRAP-type uncharacterized transport system substrate-binding protein
MRVRGTFVDRHLFLIASVLSLALVAGALWAVFAVLRPAPPKTVVMTTGPEGSSYAEFAEQYRRILARSGIELRLVPSAGSVENLNRLRDAGSGVSAGFAQGGTTNPHESPGLVSLGTIGYEPLWLFYRDVQLDRTLSGLHGKRISIGAEGSGGRQLASELLRRNGVHESLAEWLPYPPQQTEQELMAGRIQAAIFVQSWTSPVVQRLVAAPDIDLASFARADALVALYPYLNKLVLPAGAGDFANNRPAVDTLLVAPKASLVVREDLHPAIQYLLLDAAEQIHNRPGLFQQPGQFPAPEGVDLPMSDSAVQFYKSGRPFLQRYLPFWLAVLVGRLLVLLIPVAGILYPILRLTPSAFGWLMRRRIFALYGQLRAIEADLQRASTPVPELIARLDRLEQHVNRFRAPAAFASMVYTLRSHLDLVRHDLQSAATPAP